MTDQANETRKDGMDQPEVLVLGRPEVVALTQSAFDAAEAYVAEVSDAGELARRIGGRDGGVAVVDIGRPGLDVAAFLRSLSRPWAGPGIILIADDEETARASGAGVGGWVHHLFTTRPPGEHLRQFVLSAVANQQRRRSLDAETG